MGGLDVLVNNGSLHIHMIASLTMPYQDLSFAKTLIVHSLLCCFAHS